MPLLKIYLSIYVDKDMKMIKPLHLLPYQLENNQQDITFILGSVTGYNSQIIPLIRFLFLAFDRNGSVSNCTIAQWIVIGKIY